MHKKILVAIIAIITAICCTLGFTACNNENEGGTPGGNPGGSQNSEQGGNNGEDPGTDPGKDPDDEPDVPVEPEYTLSDNGDYYYFDGFTGTGEYEQTEITIASTYNGKSVKHIGKYAYTDLASVEEIDHEEQEGLFLFAGRNVTSVIIEEGIESIGTFAFDDNIAQSGSIKSITIPSSVKVIGCAAFNGCTGLTEINIPDGVKIIGESAFSGCTGLTSITIPDSVTSIGEYAFKECAALTSLDVSDGNTVYHSSGNCLIETATKTLIVGCNNSVIPKDGSVVAIGNTAFNSCIELTNASLPASITSIGDYAFQGCGLTGELFIPSSVKSIGKGAFSSCSNLQSVNIYNGATDIGEEAFRECSGLTEITLPDSVETIGDAAFAGCGELISVILPGSLEKINTWLFQNCSNLMEVTIGSSVTRIEVYAFQGCMSLKDITFKGTKAQWNNVSRGIYWDADTDNYKIHCTDDDILK